MRARKALQKASASASKDQEPKKAATQSDSKIHPYHPYLRQAA
jgi:hypothetical protein